MDVSGINSIGSFPGSSGSSGNPYGVSTQVWNTMVKTYPNLTQTLLSMPESAVNLYKNMSLKDKELFAKKIHGKTQYMFWTIDNRKAFIQGTFMGQNIFPHLENKIEQEQRDGKIPKQEASELLKAVSVSQTLTPTQREAIVTLDETETGIPPS
jgi:hypothetical protein